jgi:hypothetical protein
MTTNEARKRYSNAGGIICSVNVYDMYMHLSFPNVSVKGRSVMALTTAQLNMFLKIAHASGKLIHFDDEDLREYVIVDPAYLIEVLRSIVTEKLFFKYI